MTDVPNWVFSELQEALPPGLSRFLFKAWFSSLYGDLELTINMTEPSYDQLLRAIGLAFFPMGMDIVVQFLTILYFLRGISNAPSGRWTYLDFLDAKATIAPQITAALQQALVSQATIGPNPGPHPGPTPPPYSRFSPLVNPVSTTSSGPSAGTFGPHSYHTLPPAVLDHSPPFNSSRGDVDSDSVTNPSNTDELADELRMKDEADLEAMELEAIRDQEADMSHQGSRTLKGLLSQVRRTRSEEYRRYSSPAKPRSKIAVDKMK